MIRNVFGLLLMLMVCGAGSASVKPLSGTYLGDFQRNYYGNRAPDRLRLLWRTPLGTGPTYFKYRVNQMSGAGWTGQPLLFEENGRLVIIQSSYDHHLRKIDAASGTVLWKSLLDDSIKGTPTFFDRGYGDESTRRVMIVGSRHGFGINLRKDPAYALRGISYDDGRELWRHNVRLTDSNSRDCDASAVIFQGRAAVPLENGVFTIFSPDPLQANQWISGRWAPKIFHQTWLYRQQDRKTYGDELSCESSPTLVGGTAYIAAGCGRIYAKSAFTGRDYWELDVGGDLDGTMPLTGDGALLVAIEKQFIEGQGGVMKIRPKAPRDQAIEWFLPWPDLSFFEWKGGIVGSPTLNARYGGHFACASGVDGTLRVIDLTRMSGRKVQTPLKDRWVPCPQILDEVKLPRGAISTPIFVGNRILAAHDDGLCLYGVSAEGKLRLLDSLRGIMFDATPVVWDGRAYLAGRDGYLYCFY